MRIATFRRSRNFGTIKKSLQPKQRGSPQSMTQPCAESSACKLRDLFIFERDFQGCAKASDELSHVILPVCFFGKIAALAPTGAEIISEWFAGLRRRNGQ